MISSERTIRPNQGQNRRFGRAATSAVASSGWLTMPSNAADSAALLGPLSGGVGAVGRPGLTAEIADSAASAPPTPANRSAMVIGCAGVDGGTPTWGVVPAG